MTDTVEKVEKRWHNISTLKTKSFTCGHCGKNIASNTGYQTEQGDTYPAFIVICHVCNRPSFLFRDVQTPGARFGEEVLHLPHGISALYQEARDSMSTSSHTAAVLVCRKILMNVAVDLKADEGLSFLKYVEYLSDKNYIPPNARGWVDHIRNKGNEANHEIKIMSSDEAKELISLTEMLLKIIYEFPHRIPSATAAVIPPASPK